MRRRLLRHNQPPFEPVNVTPLIDVVMCLIIFFLIVGKLANETGNVRLPTSASGKGETAARAVTISVARPEPGSSRARVFVDGMLVGEQQPESELRELILLKAGVRPKPDGGYTTALLPVHVRCDRELPYGAVEPVLRACAALGIPGVRVATERAGPGGAFGSGGGGGGVKP